LYDDGGLGFSLLVDLLVKIVIVISKYFFARGRRGLNFVGLTHIWYRVMMVICNVGGGDVGDNGVGGGHLCI
jgi:hypothetical protein